MILAFGGRPVTGVDDLHRYLTDDCIGVPSDVAALRRGRRFLLTIVPSNYSVTRPRRTARRTASVRLAAPSLPEMDATWNLTVWSLMRR